MGRIITMGNGMTKLMSRALALSVVVFAVTGGGNARAQDAADLLLRLDRLEVENRRLTGQIDELRFKEQKLEEQFKRFQLDADSRFRDLESKGGGATAPPTPPAATGRRSDVPDAAHSGPPSVAAPAGGNPGTEIGAPADLTVNGANPALVGPGKDAASSFAYARSLVERGEYENGEIALREFQKKYARDRRVPEATFWIGESQLRRTRYREAAENFLTVTTRHSSIAKAPEAMLKLGISLRGLGATAEACGTFDQLPKKYPNASAPIKAAAEREKSRAKCS